ncbi:hypothetical protein T484DRAFT_1915378, partial [Baffinella frigidus]
MVAQSLGQGEKAHVCDVADALTCAEASCCRSPATFLDGISRRLRPAMSGELLPGAGESRVIHVEALHEGKSGTRLLVARVTRGAAAQDEETWEQEQEQVLVLAFGASQPAAILQKVLSADTGIAEGRRSVVSFLLRQPSRQQLRAPSLSASAAPPPRSSPDSLPDGMRAAGEGSAKWTRSADRFLARVVRPLLFEEGGGARREVASVSRILVTGHGAAGVVASRVFRLLLARDNEDVSARLRLITFGMPLLGWSSQGERDAEEGFLAGRMREDGVHHLLLRRDLLAQATVCSLAVRARVALAVGAAEEGSRREGEREAVSESDGKGSERTPDTSSPESFHPLCAAEGCGGELWEKGGGEIRSDLREWTPQEWWPCGTYTFLGASHDDDDDDDAAGPFHTHADAAHHPGRADSAPVHAAFAVA